MAGGVIDADFRGEVKVILVNNGPEDFVVNLGDRVGQLILQQIANVKLQKTSQLSSTVRGAAGFGSTGLSSTSLSSPSASSELNAESSGVAMRRLAQEPESAHGGVESSREVPSVGPHVFFDGVMFAREGESMADHVRRLRGGELVNFSWMFPDALVRELEKPSRRSPVSIQQPKE